MKYVTPKYELTVLETEDVLAASSEKYEIEQNDDGSGNIIMDAFNIFS